MFFLPIAKLGRNYVGEFANREFGFFREYWHNKNQTGAIRSSSLALARAMVEPYWEVTCGEEVLELGSGSGIVSEHIVRNMHPTNKLTVIEINNKFIDITRNKLQSSFGGELTVRNVSFINSDFLEYVMPANKFSLICCSLPFNNFEPEKIHQIFREMFRVCQPGGIVVFYEYIVLRRIRYWLSLGIGKNLREIEVILTDIIRTHAIGKTACYANFPPAMVYVLRKPELPCA